MADMCSQLFINEEFDKPSGKTKVNIQSKNHWKHYFMKKKKIIPYLTYVYFITKISTKSL